MYTLYHHIICPFSRKIRFLLAAKDVEFELVKENFWERRKEFIAINPMVTVPVLFDNHNRIIICGSPVIAEYIEEKHDDSKNYFGDSVTARAENRRLQMWFDEKFYNEVSRHLLKERYFGKFLSSQPAPNPEVIRLAKYNLNVHLNYIEFLLENRKFLGGEQISIADFAAAGHMSALDYFDDIPWQNRHALKDWYAVVKSQKGFAEILKDRIPGIVPSRQYDKLDF